MQIQTDLSCCLISKGPFGCFKTWRIPRLETIRTEFGTTEFRRFHGLHKRFTGEQRKQNRSLEQKVAERQSRRHIDAGPTPRYWFRAEVAEERRGNKNLNPTLRYSATSSFAKATARRVCARNLGDIARNRMSAMQRRRRQKIWAPRPSVRPLSIMLWPGHTPNSSCRRP